MAGLLSRYFGFRERATDLSTEIRAGFTTFMVMAYIIFVNPIILGFTGVPGLDGRGLPFAATLTHVSRRRPPLDRDGPRQQLSVRARDGHWAQRTIIGVGGRGGFLDAGGRLPGANRVLLTTYIESAAGVADGARTGLAPAVTGLLFLAAMFFSPLASVIPAQATAPALIIVGFFMMSIVRDIPWDDYEEAIPAFMTMLALPFTLSITNSIGAGFVTYAAIKLLQGRRAQLHWMVYV